MLPSTSATDAGFEDPEPESERRSGIRSALETLSAVLSRPQGALGSIFVGVILLIMIIGPFVAPYDPTAIGVGIPASPPSWQHLLGTDELGRDVLSRFLTGGSSVLLVPLVAITIAFVVGGSMGVLFGYLGGLGDRILTRILNVLLPIPTLLLALLLIARFGSSTFVLIVLVGIVFAPPITRVMRGATQNLRLADYILAAEARGERTFTIVFAELLPNIVGPALVEFGIRLNFAVTFIASLNFLGLAEQPPSSNWGVMAADGENLILSNPIGALVPALALAVLVVGINLLADSVAEVLSRELDVGWTR
jgi:peptide/nickel transport system permease protein